MARVYIPESIPYDTTDTATSQRQLDYVYEATQLSQPQFSQTQNTQGTVLINSQVEPRRKYWAVFIPTSQDHPILKLPWAKSCLQIGRGPYVVAGNDVVLPEKRISNRHCRITLGIPNGNSTSNLLQLWKDGEGEPEVWIEDLNSSNGTFVNGEKVRTRVLLQHGDELSLGHPATLETHDVRYIFRSVGGKGAKLGSNSNHLIRVGEIYEHYQLLNRLGKGTFAEVYRAVEVASGIQRAVKQIIKHRFANNAKTLMLFQREISICRDLHHENICQLVDAFEDPQHICLVLEYVDGGDLLDYIMNSSNPAGGGLSEDEAANFTYQICRAMAYTHSKNVAHRDLKPENILITKGSPDSPSMVKIADFGLAKMVDAQTMLTSMVGTPQYLAPEVVMQTSQKPGYENVVDSWSVGIIVYSMLTKALPFDEDADLPVDKRIKARFTQPFDEVLLDELGISAQAISFISRLLEKNPAHRMTMADALEHEWLAGPSSQPQDSHQDSGPKFPIQDFIADDVLAGETTDRSWSRPATDSGTNMESGWRGSDGSFSQPMGNLNLGTPSSSRYDVPFSRADHEPHDRGSSSFGITVDPPSLLSPRAQLTPPPSESAFPLKRKQHNGRDIDPFSSGSLSPPPLVGVDTTPTAPTRQAIKTSASPRRSSRPRKSIRLF